MDVSSSASVAAYINSLTYSLERSIGWLRGNPWRVTRSVYCTYNAFTGQDIRVEARIPGGITAYAISANGTKMATTPEMWNEVFVASILRAIFAQAGDPGNWGTWWGGAPPTAVLVASNIGASSVGGNGNLNGDSIASSGTTSPSLLSHPLHDDSLGWVAMRRLDPLPSLALEGRFLDACARLVKSAWCLGSAQGHPTGDALTNFLTQGILRYFLITCQRPAVARAFFERPSVASALGPDAQAAILATCLLAEDREPEAIRTLVEAISREPARSPACLLVEGSFLASRGRHEEALLATREAVRSSPLDYGAWLALARAQIRCEQYIQGLLSLNGCPLTLAPEPAGWTVSPGTKLWTPTCGSRAGDTDAPSDGGSTSKSKAKTGGPSPALTHSMTMATVSTATATSIPPTSPTLTDSPSSLTLAPPLALDMISFPGMAPSSALLERLRGQRLRGAVAVAYQVLVSLEKIIGWDELLRLRSRIFIMEDEYRQQQQQQQEVGSTINIGLMNGDKMEESMEQISLDEDVPNATGSSSNAIGQTVHGKRMCEKWLDSLFMILFEDLRLYTLLQGELAKARQDPTNATSRTPHRSARDWLLLGNLCARLQRPEEAKEAYRRCVEGAGGAWCQAAWLALLGRYTSEGKVGSALTAAGRILLYEAALYQETPVRTSPVARYLMHLVRDQGLVRCQTTLVGLNLNSRADGLIRKYLEVATNVQSIGYDY